MCVLSLHATSCAPKRKWSVLGQLYRKNRSRPGNWPVWEEPNEDSQLHSKKQRTRTYQDIQVAIILLQSSCRSTGGSGVGDSKLLKVDLAVFCHLCSCNFTQAWLACSKQVCAASVLL